MILSFLSEVIIILAVRMGLGSHPERIMIGIVMLLISGLSTTNGKMCIRDSLSSDEDAAFEHHSIQRTAKGAAAYPGGAGDRGPAWRSGKKIGIPDPGAGQDVPAGERYSGSKA